MIFTFYYTRVWPHVISPFFGGLEGTPAMDLGHMNVVLKWMYVYVGSICFGFWFVMPPHS